MSNLQEDLEVFKDLITEYRYNFRKLVFVIFPFGEKGHELEHFWPYDWQLKKWDEISAHLQNPLTRYETLRIIVSSGNGAAKTAFGAITFFMLMYTQRLRARITANTDPQMKSIIWPEYDVWFRRARFSNHFFEKLGTSIKAKDEKLSETWRLDTVTWDEQRPASVSGLHNKGGAVAYFFEEAPGIPAIIWEYAMGAFTETDTIKMFFAFGNSDDPNSKFEQNMTSPLWNALRIDTRTCDYIDNKQIAAWLEECGGDEDHDDFRVRVRGLPRKTAKDSIINVELVEEAIKRAKDFDVESVAVLPVIISVDSAWRGGDETVIAYQQGNYRCILEKYKLEGTDNHSLTFGKVCHWEKTLRADQVFIDQGEGTALYTLGQNAGRTSWELINFSSGANDAPEFKDSQYGNIRAQMFYETRDWLKKGGILDAKNKDWIDDIRKQLCWTKGTRHKIHGKKMAESKVDIKTRVGRSPDVADALVLLGARPVTERLPENTAGGHDRMTGGESYQMPPLPDPYAEMEETMDPYRGLYD